MAGVKREGDELGLDMMLPTKTRALSPGQSTITPVTHPAAAAAVAAASATGGSSANTTGAGGGGTTTTHHMSDLHHDLMSTIGMTVASSLPDLMSQHDSGVAIDASGVAAGAGTGAGAGVLTTTLEGGGATAAFLGYGYDLNQFSDFGTTTAVAGPSAAAATAVGPSAAAVAARMGPSHGGGSFGVMMGSEAEGMGVVAAGSRGGGGGGGGGSAAAAAAAASAGGHLRHGPRGGRDGIVAAAIADGGGGGVSGLKRHQVAVDAYLTKAEKEGGVLPAQEVTIINSRVVQKSYGTEKRFFCPPPCVKLSGVRWTDSNGMGPLCIFVGMGLNEYVKVELDGNLVGPARTLYISDQDKRKSFCMHTKIFYKNGRDVGSFTSRPVKVISKPSKKKQSLNNAEMCVESGTEISLFNRIRSQACSTRYLIGGKDGLTTDVSQWGAFVIRVVPDADTNEGDAASVAAATATATVTAKPSDNSAAATGSGGTDGSIQVAGAPLASAAAAESEAMTTTSSNGLATLTSGNSGDGAAAAATSTAAPRHSGLQTPQFITYGSRVTLECTQSGYKSPVYIVRKIAKSSVPLDADDPLSQMQKVAFALADDDRTYLSVSKAGVVEEAKVKPNPDNSNEHCVTDVCTWTISSCYRVTYRFYETQNLVGCENLPVNPVPIVNFTKKLGPNVEIYGESFSTYLTVWFGRVPAETIYRCEELLMTRPPPISRHTGESDNVCRSRLQVPLLLVRHDGVIYPTGKTYTYDVDHLILLRQAYEQRQQLDGRSDGGVAGGSSDGARPAMLNFSSLS